MKKPHEQTGERAEASGLPYGTEDSANGVASPAQGTDGTAPPGYSGETGDGGPQPEELQRRAVYERGPQ